MEEIWKDIPEYEGYYQASNMGEIRRIETIVKNGVGLAHKSGRILKKYIDRKRRQYVSLSKESKEMRFQVSRLVYSAFNGRIPKGMEVNYIDENPLNNRLDNLNLMTPWENKHYGTGIKRMGKLHKKPVTQILLDGTEYMSYFSAQDAAYATGIRSANITSCCKKRPHCKTAGGFKWRYAS